MYIPVLTDVLPAPSEFMDLVKCKCKIESCCACSALLCSCAKHGLPCIIAYHCMLLVNIAMVNLQSICAYVRVVKRGG